MKFSTSGAAGLRPEQLDKALKLMSHRLLCHGVKELYVFFLKAKAN